MKQKNALTPIPLAPAIPAILEALGLGALAYGASEAGESESTPIGSTYTGPTTWDIAKPMLQIGANYLANEANEAWDFFSSIPDAYGNQMRRFLATASPRPVSKEVIQPTYVHAGWNRVNGGYRYYDPNLGMTTETYIDPVVIEGTYTSPYNQTTSLRAEPIVKMTPLVNTSRPIPIELSSGQVVALPTDITDYRVFDEAAGDDEDGVVVIRDEEGAGTNTGTGTGTNTGTNTGTGTGTGGGSPRRNDDDDDNQISSVEEYIRRFGKDINRRTARRLRKSERVSHDANGNINHRATKLLNRGTNAGTGGAGGAKSGGYPWQTLLFGTSLGAGAVFGGQAIFGGKEEVKAPEPHGEVKYDERAKGAIDQVVEDNTESAPIQADTIDWGKIKF